MLAAVLGSLPDAVVAVDLDTGMGLSVARGLLERVGGTILARSPRPRPGLGVPHRAARQRLNASSTTARAAASKPAAFPT